MAIFYGQAGCLTAKNGCLGRPRNIIVDFKSRYKDVKALLRKHSKDANTGEEEEEEEELSVDREMWRAWMLSGTPITQQIKQKMSDGDASFALFCSPLSLEKIVL
jgi:hypothetical protein